MNLFKMVIVALALAAPLAWGQSAGACPTVDVDCSAIWAQNNSKAKPSDVLAPGVYNQMMWMNMCSATKREFCTCWEKIASCKSESSLVCTLDKGNCYKQLNVSMEEIKGRLPK